MRWHPDTEVEGFSVGDGVVRQVYKEEDEFVDFDENDSVLSDTACIAGHVIYKQSQRDALLRKRVELNP